MGIKPGNIEMGERKVGPFKMRASEVVTSQVGSAQIETPSGAHATTSLDRTTGWVIVPKTGNRE